ncbi:MAG: bifunctional tetrahydrofolate synthase/dihydrofolate synthase [Gammaproteobacteria bacterium]|jgi:dihydrofolate synthase/folylpolyglutamate synthase
MPHFNSLDEWLQWQETLHPVRIDPGLPRIRRVAARMGLLAPRHTVVTVAGTNGKGSSVALLEAILLAEGYRVGAYSSPHLLRYNERIRCNGVAVDDAALCAVFDEIDRQRDETLSYFEFGTLAALLILEQSAPDIGLLEVGLGGRLDAVNIIDPDIALVTGIGIDHVQWLGKDRESIGIEKAGIFRPGRPAVCSDPAPPSSLAQVAADLGAPWYCLKRHFDYTREDAAWHWFGADQHFEALPFPALAGAHQLENAAGVLMALTLLREQFPVPRSAIVRGLERVSLAGRCQRIPGAVEMILDVAHNPHGAACLVELLRRAPVAGQTHVVLAMLEDKDVGGYAAALQPVADRWYPAGLGAARGLPAEALRQRMAEAGIHDAIETYPDVGSACQRARQLAVPGDRIVVCGSFYTVAAAMECAV